MGEFSPSFFMDLWKEYKRTLYKTFPDLKLDHVWADWSGDTNLRAEIWKSPQFIKSRAVDIWSEKSNIYNTIMYPKTGKNLPCFGMDLMGFFEKKVIIVFDFQHPVENYLFSVGDKLPKAEGTFRFFEPGNHFSEHVYVRKCTMSEVNNYLDDFAAYLQVYKDMLESADPQGTDETEYMDFDSYMKKLDPVSGYLANNFGKERAEQFVDEFLFPYG